MDSPLFSFPSPTLLPAATTAISHRLSPPSFLRIFFLLLVFLVLNPPFLSGTTMAQQPEPQMDSQRFSSSLHHIHIHPQPHHHSTWPEATKGSLLVPFCSTGLTPRVLFQLPPLCLSLLLSFLKLYSRSLTASMVCQSCSSFATSFKLRKRGVTLPLRQCLVLPIGLGAPLSRSCPVFCVLDEDSSSELSVSMSVSVHKNLFNLLKAASQACLLSTRSSLCISTFQNNIFAILKKNCISSKKLYKTPITQF